MRSPGLPHSPRRLSRRATSFTLTMLALAYSLPAFAAAPAATTLGALARQEGWDPDAGDPRPNLAREIPRDFPVPVTSHHLVASNVFPKATVSGTPEETDAFYSAVFPAQGWTVKKHLKFAGHITIIACKAGECVNLSSNSAEVDASNPNLIKMSFYPEKLGKP